MFTTTGPKDLADALPGLESELMPRIIGVWGDLRALASYMCVFVRLTDADMRLQTSLSRRRSSITVHPQSTVFASVRSGCERCSIHAPREVTKLEELVPRVCELGNGWGSE